MKLSKKKSKQLYDIVHEEIMLARIKIAQLGPQDKQIDNILSDLTINCPQKAIDLFNPR